MKSKIIIFLLIAVILGILVGFFFANGDYKNVNSNINQNKIQTVAQNNTKDKTNNDTQNELENNIKNDIDNQIQNNVIEENNIINDEIPTSSNVEVKDNRTDEEKALDIAKKDWGEDSTVYFKYEGIDSGKYIVCVRKKETTVAINWYIIDLSTGTFEIN